MTALLPALLSRSPPSVPRALPSPAGPVLALLPPPATPAATRPAQRPREPRKASAAPVPGVLQAVPALQAVAPSPPPAPVSRSEDAPVFHLPQEPASAPLRLDTQVLRRAARDSAGIARAAQAVAGEGAAAASPQQALSQAIERAGLPDCIGPNAQGSLLSLPKLALDAATGKCK